MDDGGNVQESQPWSGYSGLSSEMFNVYLISHNKSDLPGFDYIRSWLLYYQLSQTL